MAKKIDTPGLRSISVLSVMLVSGGCGMSPDAHILSADQGPALMEQCSRSAPAAEAFWTPSETDVTWAEDALGDFEAVTNPGQFIRQYVGIELNGMQMMYLNAIHRDVANTLDADFSQAVVICDGGESAWGVLYDYYRGEFTDMQFNGG